MGRVNQPFPLWLGTVVSFTTTIWSLICLSQWLKSKESKVREVTAIEGDRGYVVPLVLGSLLGVLVGELPFAFEED